MSNKIFLFRHAESYDNEYALFSGGRNTGLSQGGYEEAEKLANRLKEEHIDIAYTSDLIRSLDTMTIVLKYHPKVIICIDKRIRERSYGLLEGQSKKAWSKYAYPIFKIFHRSYRIPPPGGESFLMVKKRINAFIQNLEEQIRGKNLKIAICVHSGSIRPFRQYFENIPDSEFTKIETRPTELFTYIID